ncbi:MAG: LysR family transcriptional regulator [Pseudomonadota bacterium]
MAEDDPKHMIELRDMQLLVALSRHRHFARAARECGLSQPAFSMRIRNLEAHLGSAIVRRGNRLEGFTDEGHIVLRWARKLLDDARAMEQELQSAKGVLSGRLTIGVVPTALAFGASLPIRLAKSHPRIRTQIKSASSLQILTGLEDGSIDVGITYADGVPEDLMRQDPLYDESYMLVAPRDIAPRREGEASWAEAATLPLSLLVPEMQNRRILDLHFAQMGLQPLVVAEVNAFSASILQVHAGFAATIVPQVLVSSLEGADDLAILTLSDLSLIKAISLVSPRRKARTAQAPQA